VHGKTSSVLKGNCISCELAAGAHSRWELVKLV